MSIPSLPLKETIILEIIVSSNSELYGFEIVSKNPKLLKFGTIYTTLHRMQEKGYIISRCEDSTRDGQRGPNRRGMRKRLYKATNKGKIILEIWGNARREFDAWRDTK